jgi:hypothetical protein
MDIRRRWFDGMLTAAVFTEPGKDALPAELLMFVGLPEPLDLENSSANAAGVNDDRR